MERVFLEDVARRGLGRFVGARAAAGGSSALCHVGANVVPAGERVRRLRPAGARAAARGC